MSFQRVFPRERLAASTITQERLLAGVSIPVAFEIVLAVERECAHVTRERPLWRRGVL